MDKVVDRVMRTYGMIANLTLEQEVIIRDKVVQFLSGIGETDENKLAVEGLRFVRSNNV